MLEGCLLEILVSGGVISLCLPGLALDKKQVVVFVLTAPLRTTKPGYEKGR